MEREDYKKEMADMEYKAAMSRMEKDYEDRRKRRKKKEKLGRDHEA
jgi:hypothetical protein